MKTKELTPHEEKAKAFRINGLWNFRLFFLENYYIFLEKLQFFTLFIGFLLFVFNRLETFSRKKVSANEHLQDKRAPRYEKAKSKRREI